jgi:DNA-binding NarL/FixJ family response regulator
VQGAITVRRVFIAYETAAFRAGVRALIVQNVAWQFCGEARLVDAYDLAMATQPDVVLIEMAPPEKGRNLARLLRDDLPKAQCLLFTFEDGAAKPSP